MNSILKKIILSGAISTFGTNLRFIVWPFYAYKLTGSTTIMATIYLVEQIAEFVGTLVAGAMCDTYDRKKLVITSQIMMAVSTLMLVTLTKETIYIAYLASFLLVSFGEVSRLSFDSFFNEIIPRTSNLRTQYSRIDRWIQISGAFASLIGGLLITLVGIIPVFIIDSLTFLVCAYLYRDIEYKSEIAKVKFSGSLRKEAAILASKYKEGLEYSLKKNRKTLYIYGIAFLTSLGVSVSVSSNIVFLKDMLSGTEFDLSVWRMTIKLGLIAGSTITGSKIIDKMSNTQVMKFCHGILLPVSFLGIFFLLNKYCFFAITFVSYAVLYMARTAFRSETLLSSDRKMSGRILAFRNLVIDLAYISGHSLNIILLTHQSGRFSFLFGAIMLVAGTMITLAYSRYTGKTCQM